jgi:hypothetical protein
MPLLVVIYLPWTAAAPVYKSTDAEGNVTYSSEPPPESKQVQEVAVPKDSPASADEGGDSVDAIRQKADALQQENTAREKEIQKKKQEQETKPAVKTEPPVQHYQPIANDRPKPKPPAGGGGVIKPKPVPLPSGK